MKKMILWALLCMALLTGCKGDTDVPNETSNNVTNEAPTQGEPTYVRTASTVKTDSKTGSIITYQQSFQLDTEITISIYSDKEVESSAFDAIFETIDFYEQMISKTIETSDVSQINKNAGVAPVKVSDEIIEILDIAMMYAEASEGLFDVTIGPVVSLWGIGTDEAAIPGDAEDRKSVV